MDSKENLRNQISDCAGNVLYTYSSHWNKVTSLKRQYFWIKIIQIVLIAATTAGLITTLSYGISWLSWLSTFSSASALFINLYMYSFNPSDEIKKHTDAANELWIVRESFKSLLVDFEDLRIDEIRSRRDELNKKIGDINKTYPGTDDNSFSKAQREIGKYRFEKGESASLINTDHNEL